TIKFRSLSSKRLKTLSKTEDASKSRQEKLGVPQFQYFLQLLYTIYNQTKHGCFAYVEFLEQEAVQEAIQEALNLNESELHGRQIKVAPKRTNVPGMKQRPPRGYNPYHGYPYRSYGAPYFPPYGYG
ncbi:hypothetical protein ACJX0J_039453, partial [Zea mays]